MLISGSRNTSCSLFDSCKYRYYCHIRICRCAGISFNYPNNWVHYFPNLESYTRLWYRYHPDIRNLMKQFICRWARVVTLIAFIQPIRKELVDRIPRMNNHHMTVKCIHYRLVKYNYQQIEFKYKGRQSRK